MPKPEHVAASARPGRSAAVPVGELAAAEVLVERRRLAVEVGHGQVGPAVAVEVAAGDAHARPGSPPRRWWPPPTSAADLLEAEAAPVAEQELAVMSLATNRSIRPSSSRSAATTPSPGRRGRPM